jgi:FAD dependent oxidoreductase TIGR03364
MGDNADIIVVGAGIVGLAHALHAARAGHRVLVLDRDAQANGASIRNFGFVTVTGQGAPHTWRRARRARDVWAEVAPLAGIAIHHRGLLMAARRPEALTVLEEFAAGPMGEGCRILRGDDLHAHAPPLRHAGVTAALHSPHDLRVESRDAIPRLAAWLGERHGVLFRRGVRCMAWSTARCGRRSARSARRASSSARAPTSRRCSPRPSPAAASRSASCTCCAWPTPAGVCPRR